MAYAAGAAGTALAPVAPVEIEYPSSDGEPVAESYFQLIPLFYAFDALQRRYADRDDVFVATDLLIYYRKGTMDSVAPDVFVVFGAANRPRHSYQLWKEPKGPDFVLEVTSASTQAKDQGPKRETYRQLGVREYWQYDPTGDYLKPPLQGLELIGGRYERLPEEELADETLRLESKVLGLEVRHEAERLRFYDPVTRSYLLASAEEQQGRQRAEQRSQWAEQRWQRAEDDRQLEAAARRQTEARLQDEAAARRQAEAARRLAEARLHGEAAARRQAETARRQAEAAQSQAEARIAALEALLRERGENDTPGR